MIFVDTSAWFAAVVATDPNHSIADSFLDLTEASRLVTTDFILDEVLTLFQIRGFATLGISLGRKILEGEACAFTRISDADLLESFRVFSQFRDKGWSFTDCTSYVVIERMKIKQAFAFDRHFSQFGIVEVVPGER